VIFRQRFGLHYGRLCWETKEEQQKNFAMAQIAHLQLYIDVQSIKEMKRMQPIFLAMLNEAMLNPGSDNMIRFLFLVLLNNL